MSLQALSVLIEHMIHGWLTLGAGAFAFLCCVLGVVLGIMRGVRANSSRQGLLAGRQEAAPRCTPWPELVTAVATLAPAALIVAGMARARQLQLEAFLGVDPAKRMEIVAQGIAGQLHTMAVGSSLLLVLLPPLGLAWGLLLWGRRRCCGVGRAAALIEDGGMSPAARAYLQHPGPPLWHLLVLALGITEAVFSPFLLLCVSVTVKTIQAFSAVAGADPTRRFEMMDLGVSEAQQMAGVYSWASLAGLVVMTVVAFVLLGPLSAARKRARLAPELSSEPTIGWPVTAVLALVLLAAAAGCAVLALPYHQENKTPLVSRPGCDLAQAEQTKAQAGQARAAPKKDPDDVVPDSFADYVPSVDGEESQQYVSPILPSDIKVPRHAGPDTASQALEVHVSLTATEVEGQSARSPAKLFELLKKHATRLRKIEKMTNGKMPFKGRARLVAHRDLPALKLKAVLAAGAKVGFHRWLLIFADEHRVVRPLLGSLRFTCPSAAKVQLALPGKEPEDARQITVAKGEGSPASLLPAKGAAARVLLKLAPAVKYDRWSAVVVEARKRKMEVLVQVPAGE